MVNVLLKLSENDKRIIIALLLVFIIVFVLCGFIGSIIVRVMKYQGKKMDTLCHDVVITKVVNDKKHFLNYARKKNNREFYKKSIIPICLLLVAAGVYIATCAIRKEWPYDIFDYHSTGIGTLFYVWNFSDCYSNFFGLTLLSKWPTNTFNTPHFSNEAIPAYIFVIIFLVGIIWYLIVVQGFMARLIRIHKLADSIFSKSLSDYNVAKEEEEKLKKMEENA